MSQVRDAYDAAARAYDTLFVEANRARWQEAYLRRVSPGMRVLDAGCGTGTDSLACARAGAEVLGVDISPGMLERARDRAAAEGFPVRFVDGDIARLPGVDEASFDLVISGFAALNTVSEPGAFAAGAARALRPGGELLVHFLGTGALFDRLGDASRGRLSQALRGGAVREREIRVGDRAVRHWLYAPRALYAASFARHFELVELLAVGVCTPDDGPSRVPAALGERLERLDRRLGRWPLFSSLGRFAILAMRRRG